MWLINIHESVLTRLWKSTLVCTMVVWALIGEAEVWYLYNIGWHWGLYMRIYCTRHEWYSPSRYGEVNIIHDKCSIFSYNRNKAKSIQNYYYYYIIWSWLCSEEVLTILMYTVYVSLQYAYRRRRQDSDKLVLAYQLLSRKLWLHYFTILPILNICTLPGCLRGCLCIWWFLLILLGKNYRKFHARAAP